MILLNVVRVLITLFGLIFIDALRVAYSLDGFALLVLVALGLLVVFVLSDLAEDALIAYFNREETTRG